MEIKELEGFFTRLTGKSDEEVNTFLYKDVTAEVKEYRTAEEIASSLSDSVSAKFTKVGDDNRRRGKREALQEYEKSVRKKYDFDSTLQGLELIDELLNDRVGKIEPKTIEVKKDVEITDDWLKANPVAQDWAKRMLDPVLNERDEIKETFEGYKRTQYDTKVNHLIRKELIRVYEENKVRLGEGNNKASRIDGTLERASFSPKNFRLSEEGRLIPIDKNGNPQKDAHMNMLSFDSYAMQKNMFGIQKFDETKKGTGAVTTVEKTEENKSKSPFADSAAFISFMQDKSIPKSEKDAKAKLHLGR